MDETYELKRQIQRIQVQRKLAKQRHEKKATHDRERINQIESIFNSVRGRKHNMIYQEVLEEVMGPCREKEEYRLLEISHKIEVNEKLLELMVQQYRKLTDYMVCEINVMEEERKDIQQRNAAKSTILMEEMSRFMDCFDSNPLPSTKSTDPRRSSTCRNNASKVPRRRSSIFSMAPTVPDMDESDSLSVVSDLSISVSSYLSNAVRSVTDHTSCAPNRAEFDLTGMQMKQPALIPEEEKFTVIKL